MWHSALLWYLNPCFFSLRHYLVIHKEVLGCSVVFYSSKIFVLLRQSWACISRYLSPAPFAFRKITSVRGNFCNPCTRLRILGARATHCQQRKRERPNGNTDSKPMVLSCVFSLCLRSALAEYIFLASVSFAGLQGGDVNHVTSYFSPRDIMRILSGTTMQLDITKRERNPSCRRGKG